MGMETKNMSRTRVAVVTGSNKGIGFATVKELCSKFDGDVYLTSRDKGRGFTAFDELRDLGLKPQFHQLDIDDEASVLKLRDFIKAKYGELDVLVNNAGVAFFERACKILFPILMPHARVVNLSSCMGHLSMIRGTKKANMDLKEKFSSRNLTEEELCNLVEDFLDAVKRGDHGQRGWPTLCGPPYIVSKIAVAALTRIQQREFDQDSRQDIVVNCVHPGYIKTDMTFNQGPLSPEQGAVAPTWLALLPKNVEKPRGDYVWLNKQIVDWIHGPMPECVGLTLLYQEFEKYKKPQ